MIYGNQCTKICEKNVIKCMAFHESDSKQKEYNLLGHQSHAFSYKITDFSQKPTTSIIPLSTSFPHSAHSSALKTGAAGSINLSVIFQRQHISPQKPLFIINTTMKNPDLTDD
jgi:hypothetical protein